MSISNCIWKSLKYRAILVNPTDINAISQAIRKLKSDPVQRAEKAAAALQAARSLAIKQRTENILEFLNAHAGV